MMKTILLLKRLAISAILVGFSTAVTANDGTFTTTQDQLTSSGSVVQYNEALASISNDRYGTIAGIVAIWVAELGYLEGMAEELTAALNAATDAQLLAIQDATSYSDIQAILQGRDAPVSMEGVASPEALGDSNQDLVFTPVLPCRFFDTRFDNVAGQGHTSGGIATTRSYLVHGTALQLAHQGHNLGNATGPGCPAPKGEPVGIHGNFTAAGAGGNGNIRAFPFLGTLPLVSLVNYTAGVNIANAGSVATCFGCGDDISITTQFGSSDQIGDVMGYYYPATLPVNTLYYSIPAHTCSGTALNTLGGCSNPKIVRTEANTQHTICTFQLSTSTRETISCPLNLPDGASVEEIVLFGHDGQNFGYYEGWAYSRGHDFATNQWDPLSTSLGGAWATSGLLATPGAGSLVLLPLSDPDVVIDNQNKHYVVQFGGRAANVSSIRVRYRSELQ